MTLEKFRVNHSRLVEHYQFIEHNLEGIYAAVCGEYFYGGLLNVENDTIKRLLQKIEEIEKENNKKYIPNEMVKRIEKASTRRNFWCHNCYVDLVFKANGDLKHEKDAKALADDIREAELLREELFNIKDGLLFGNSREFLPLKQ